MNSDVRLRLKSVSEHAGDNILGSTGIAGSFSTGLHFKQYKKRKLYTVESDQTHRDPVLGEVDETLVNRDSIAGVITLGSKFEDLKNSDKKNEWEVRRQNLYRYVSKNAGKTADELAKAVDMSKDTVLSLLEAMEKDRLVYHEGEGKRGDPKRYSVTTVTVGKTVRTQEKEMVC